MVNLGVGTDLPFTVQPIAVSGNGHGHGACPIRCSARAAPARRPRSAGSRSRRCRPCPAASMTFARLTPQASGMSFAGQDNRLNNITVDGSYFNNSFGLQRRARRAHRRRADLARSHRAGAGQRRAVRRPPGQLRRRRRQHRDPERHQSLDRLGLSPIPQRGLRWHRSQRSSVQSREFNFRNTGVWAGGPIVKNRLFAFGNYEDEEDSRPLTTFRANMRRRDRRRQHDPRPRLGPQSTRARSCRSGFELRDRPFEGYDDLTPAKRFLHPERLQPQQQQQGQLPLQPPRLGHRRHRQRRRLARSRARLRAPPTILSFQNSNYQQHEDIRSGIGEWNSILGN